MDKEQRRQQKRENNRYWRIGFYVTSGALTARGLDSIYRSLARIWAENAEQKQAQRRLIDLLEQEANAQ